MKYLKFIPRKVLYGFRKRVYKTGTYFCPKCDYIFIKGKCNYCGNKIATLK